MNDDQGAIHREKDLNKTVTAANQFFEELASLLVKYENDPKELCVKVREAIKKLEKD